MIIFTKNISSALNLPCLEFAHKQEAKGAKNKTESNMSLFIVTVSINYYLNYLMLGIPGKSYMSL